MRTPSLLLTGLLLWAGAAHAQTRTPWPTKTTKQEQSSTSTTTTTTTTNTAAPAAAPATTVPAKAGQTTTTQTTKTTTIKPASKYGAKPKPVPGTKDGVAVTGGVTTVTEYGRPMPLADTASYKLVNGIVVRGNGSFTRPDGTTTQLVEGDYLSLSGRLTTMKMKMTEDSTRKADLQARKTASKKKKGLFGR